MSEERSQLWVLPPVVTLLFGWVSLFFPHGRDQGSYAYAGWRLLEGEVPYRDVFVFKPPGTVAVHALAEQFFGLDPIAIRLLDLPWFAITGLLVARLAHALGASFQAGIWAGCLVPLIYFQIDYWNTAQTDGWLVLPAVAALLLLLRETRTHWFVGGLLAGVALMFKYTAAAYALPALAVVFLVEQRRGERLLLFVLGAATSVGATFGLLYAAGAWPAFIDSQLGLVPYYVVEKRKGSGVLSTLEKFIWLNQHRADVGPLIIGGISTWVFAVAGLWKRPAAIAVVLGLVVSALAMIFAQGKYYDYHYLPLLVPAAVGGGFLFDGLRRVLERWLPHAAAVGALWAVVFVGMGASQWRHYALEGFSVVSGQQSRDELWSSVPRYAYTDYSVAEIEQTALWIAEHSFSHDPIFVWSYEPEVLLRARRRQVSRFLYNYPFRVERPEAGYDEELAAALAETWPKLIVVGSQDGRRTISGTPLDSYRLFVHHPVLKPFVRNGYCETHKIGRYRIYTPCGQGGSTLPSADE